MKADPLSFEEDEQQTIKALKQKIKSLSTIEKEKRQIYAIATGCQVRFCSSYDRNHQNYSLDYSIANTMQGWYAKVSSVGVWIEICSETPRFWTKLIMQGVGNYVQWVTAIKVKSSNNGHTWEDVDNGKAYHACYNQQDKVDVVFDQPVYARVIRIYPQAWHGAHMALRFEGVYIDHRHFLINDEQKQELRHKDSKSKVLENFGDLDKIKKMSQEQRQDCQVYAVASGALVKFSSSSSVHYHLNENQAGTHQAWTPAVSQLGQWAQVSIQIPKYWTNVIVQGRGDHPSWVTSLKVVYTKNGKTWKNVDDGKIYQASSGQDLEVSIDFKEPVLARALRIYPQTWQNNMSMRFEAVYLDI